jgi:hypothetical protein
MQKTVLDPKAMSILRVVGTPVGFVFPKRATRFVQRSLTRGLSPTGDRQTAGSHFSKTKKKSSDQDYFFGFALRSRSVSPKPSRRVPWTDSPGARNLPP